jgi:hypothetical protein
MTLQRLSYSEVRSELRVGDVIAFKGDSAPSRGFSAGAAVSHAGMILDSAQPDGNEPRFVESTIFYMEGRKVGSGVHIAPTKDIVEGYHGTVWWLPLSEQRRETLDTSALQTFITSVNGAPFDLSEGAQVVAREFLERLRGDGIRPLSAGEPYFCSELVAEALRCSSIVIVADASDVSPTDLCAWRLYSGTYFQLKGDNDKEIPHYNDRDPGRTRG